MEDKKIILSLDNIMSDRFGRYSKYIIQERALPDVRDGLKPVQRRILYSMYKEGNLASKPYRKSAKTVGNVIGNYHPHGDSSVYDAMTRLSQDWKMSAPLVDMQGNNGSIDNDPAAAMRYTEARLSPLAAELLNDIDKDTVLMALNFDDSDFEPTVLPASYPNLLVNGSTGISAGYATDIPPHNLNEVIDATAYRIKHPTCNLSKLMEYIKGPDFPTGGIIEGVDGIKAAYKKGRGKIVCRAKCEIVEHKKMNQIIVTQIPYEVNKAELVRKIDEINYNRDVEGILEVRDESDRTGLRVVVDLSKDIDAQNTLNYLYKNTDLQKNYNFNMVAINHKRPELMGLVDIIDGYIDHQIDVVTNRSLYDLAKAKSRYHIVEGLIKAIDILDEVVSCIRHSKNKADAKENLHVRFDFTLDQAEAIVMLQLYRLTNTDIETLVNEQNKLEQTIAQLSEILNNDDILRDVIVTKLKEIKKVHGFARRSEIKDEVLEVKVDKKAMILEEDTYVSITRDGYVKKISPRSYSASNTPFGIKDGDYLIKMTKATTVQTLLMFTDKGNYLFAPIHLLEEFKWKDVGKHISYLIKLDSSEQIVDAIIVDDFAKPLYIVIASKDGMIKKTALSEFEVTRFSRGLKAMNLKKDDRVVSVNLTPGNLGIIVASKNGYSNVYYEGQIAPTGIKTGGIKAISLKNDELVSCNVFNPVMHQSLILITVDNRIKRIKINDIPITNRGVKGNLLFKNLKTKIFATYKCLVCDLNDEIKIFTDKNEHVVIVKNLSNANLEAKPNNITKDSEIVEYVYHEQESNTQFYDNVILDNYSNWFENKNAKAKETDDSFEQMSLDDLLNTED